MAARTRSLSVLEDNSMERLIAGQVSKVMTLAPPWAILLVVATVAESLHLAWGASTAAVAGLAVGGAAISLLTGHVTRQRDTLGRWFATMTAVVTAAWLDVAVVTGVQAHWTLLTLVIGGGSLAVAWNIRVVVRQHAWDDADHLTKIFADAAETAGLGRSRLQVRSRSERKVEAVLILPAGEKVADDAVRRAGYLESGMRFPPGSVSIAPSPDRADHALVRISDPRVMRQPALWPGPSRSGTSVALPLEFGLWQDAEIARVVLPGTHLMIMGQTGSGKSVGGGWSLLSELITRRDVAVVAIDITKGTQTLGPLEPALHRLETTKDGAGALLAGVHASIRPRTDYLAARGLQKWAENCGLPYLVVWVEEAPDVLDALSDAGRDRFLSALKAARSAGITYVLSLQRADWSQLPTLARGQLAHMCFGTANAHDAGFGLSEVQQERNCRPELWGSSQPGMCYLDAPSVPDDRKAMALRTWFWGDSDRQIREHAGRWPAARRPLDDLTAAATGGAIMTAGDDQDDDDGMAGLVEQFAPVEEPADAEIPPEVIEVPAGDFGRWTFGPPPAEKMDAAVARDNLAVLITAWRDAGRTSFAISDLADFRASTGLSRAWLYKAVGELAEASVIERDDGAASSRWLIGP
jgi:hypothetical protein